MWRIGEEQDGGTVRSLKNKLGRGETNIKRDEDGPAARRGVDQGHIIGAVGGEDGQAVAGAQATGNQACGQIVGVLVQLGEGPGDAGGEEGHAVGVRGGAAGEPIGDDHNMFGGARRGARARRDAPLPSSQQ